VKNCVDHSRIKSDGVEVRLAYVKGIVICC
jgi:hypothetical protein